MHLIYFLHCNIFFFNLLLNTRTSKISWPRLLTLRSDTNSKIILCPFVLSDRHINYMNPLDSQVNGIEIALITVIPTDPMLCLYKSTEGLDTASWHAGDVHYASLQSSLFTLQSSEPLFVSIRMRIQVPSVSFQYSFAMKIHHSPFPLQELHITT